MSAVLVAAALAACFEPSTVPAGSGSSPAGAPRGAPAATVDGAQLDLRLDALTAPQPQRTGADRNPFQFAGEAGADDAGADDAAAADPGRLQVARSGPTAATTSAGGTRPRLRFIALADAPRSAGLIAVLSDGDTVFQGRVGDTIDGRYRIMSIGADRAEVALLQTGERQVLHLDGT